MYVGWPPLFNPVLSVAPVNGFVGFAAVPPGAGIAKTGIGPLPAPAVGCAVTVS